MNRFTKHIKLAGFLFFILISLPNFATNTLHNQPNMVDSVRLYATRTTTTIPADVNIDITVGSFTDIKEFVFTVGWDASKLQLIAVDNNYESAFSGANIDLSDVSVGKIHFIWSGSPTTFVNGTQVFRIRFYAQFPSPSPIFINFLSDPPTYTTVFKNSLNQTIPSAGSYGQVRIVTCNRVSPGLTCRNPTLLCAKDMPVCGTLPVSNTQDNPGPTISCGNIQNNVWLAFIAGSDSLKLKIKASTCNGGGVGGVGDGIQISILETNDCVSYTRLACNAGIRNGEEAILEVPEGGRLTIGKQYYIMLDGVAADVCDFQIDVMAGTIGSPITTIPAISGASIACANQANLPFSIPAQTGANSYLWKIANNTATISSGNNTRSVNINWGTVSDSVCVRVVGRCDTSAWLCKFVGIGTQSVRNITVEKCATQTYFFNNQTLSNPGNYSATFTSSTGCDSVVNLTLANYPAATRTIDSTVCIGSSVRIGTNNYSVAGTYKDTFRGTSYHGCDSIVTLNLIVIQSGVSLIKSNDLSCTLLSSTLTANYTKTPTTAVASFEWTNSMGQIVSTNSTATVTAAGIYKFKLTLTLNGISCSQERTITIVKNGSTPTRPDLLGVTQSCATTAEIFRINNPVGGNTYNWLVTGGSFSGAGSSQISVNWNAGVTSAMVCVDAENACGKSDTICKSVDVAKIPTPLSISGEGTVCPNTIGSYSVTATANVTTYQWSVTNGTIASGQGTPNLAVSWGASTTGRVCFTPTNRCGAGTQTCFDVQISNSPPDSLPIQGNTTVCSNDTSVFSINISGSMQFNWEVPTGATLLRGQATNTILVLWGNVLGNTTIGLTMTNACNLTRRVTSSINVKNSVLNAPVISGTATVCPMSRANYSVPTNASITAYKWTVPTGATIVGSSTTNSVLVDWASSSGGNVCVEIQNDCNVKKSACLTVEVKTTLDSLSLTGSNIVCKDSTAVFEVQNDPNAGGYFWGVPTGAIIVSGINTSKITVRFGSSSGLVRVTPLGGCADGQVSRISVTVKNPPSSPANIIGTTTVCEASVATFSITPLSNVVGYQWQVPNGATIVGDSTGTQITVNLGTARGGQICARGINACGAGFWACTTITVFMKPVVNAGTDTTVCGTRTLLRGQTTASVQTWSVADKPTGATVSFLNAFASQTDVIVSKSGVYVLKFESSNAIGCSHADSIRIDFKELPGLALVSETCDLEAIQYRVQLNITGNAAPYTMSGSVNGIVSGNTFTSNPIVNGTAYNFTVKDNFGCVSNQVSGLKNCPCYTVAGTLRPDSLVVCYGFTGRVFSLNDAKLDGNDAAEFVLHDGSPTQRGTILKRNKTGTFDTTNLQFNRVYYIAYIVGDTLANGSVDLTKPCTSTSRSIPIVFKNRLIAGLTGDTTICRFDNALLKLNTNLAGTFNITFRAETGNQLLTNVLSGQTLPVNPTFSTTYVLLEVKDKNGCVAELTDSARVNLRLLPLSNAGVDRSICTTSTLMDAAENLLYKGLWTSLTNNVRVLSPSDRKSVVENLQNGTNTLVWSVADTVCPNYTVRDTVQIFLPLLPKANTLSLITTVGKPVSGTVNENAPIGTYTITQLTNPVAGTFDLFNNGSFTYRPDTSFIGIVKFKFAICSDICTRLCDTGEVRILINPKPKDTVVTQLGEIPNAITPNGDGKNDVLRIDGIEQYPNNELIIFNRWGDIIYKAKPYLNDWQGVNQSGGELPEGTYYYVLRLNVNDGKILRGNMTILR